MMKLAWLALLATPAVLAATSTGPITDRGFQPIRGTSNVGSPVATEAACWDVLRAWSEANRANITTAKCRNEKTRVITYSAPPPPPPASNMPAIDVSKIPVGDAGYATARVRTASEAPGPSSRGEFRVACRYSHMNFDDAIVFPGGSGTTHLHTYFGNTGSNGQSTAQSLLTTGNSTCDGGIVNRSSYWIPTIIDTRTGTPVAPRSLLVYYKAGYSQIDPTTIRPLPPGLRMIAGSPRATTPKPRESWESEPNVFRCETSAVGRETIPVCQQGDEMWLLVHFPQCWDGVNLDSPDHKSHMAYRVGDAGGRCPSTHPVALPEITFNAIYPVATGTTASWRLSSDNYSWNGSNAGYSIHGDWFNGWDSVISDTWVRHCINAGVDCHAHLLGDGRAIY